MNHAEGKLKTQSKILIAANHLKSLGGSEMYTYTLASHLLKLGYAVDILTYSEGLVSENLKNLDSNCTIIKAKDLLERSYDLALISHNSLFILPIKSKYTIQISHGVFPFLEQPTYLADYHIAISDEVSEHLKNLGFENEVIHNPVDLERFYPKKPINKKIRNVLSLCQGKLANNFLEELCKEEKLNLVCYSKFGESRWDIENAINEADLVISLGRGVMESMACGRSVLIYDNRPYSGNFSDGLLLSNNIEEIKKCNFSGRRFKFNPTKEFLKNELAKYNIEQGTYNLEYAKRNFDVAKVIEKIFDVAKAHKTTGYNKNVYKELFSHYENKILFDMDDKPYFIRNHQKCLIENVADLNKFISRFHLNEISILKGKRNFLNLLPNVSFPLMAASQRNLNAIRKWRKQKLKERNDLSK